MRRPSLLAAASAALAALAAVLPAAPAASAAATAAAPVAAAAPAAPAAATAVRGGDRLYGAGGVSCTVGFNARGGGSYYALVAGHCALAATTWYADPALTVPAGATEAYSFPGDDYGIIRYTNPSLSHPGEVHLGGGVLRDVTGAAAPRIGQSVCHVGRTTGTRCGTVTGLNATVDHGGGQVVHGLVRSNACAEPGDTGGPAFSGTLAVGLLLGGSGSCSSGGAVYYQPVTEALAAYGLSLY